MNDVLPGEIGRWHEMEAVAREVFALYGYREVRTPIVEHAQRLFDALHHARDGRVRPESLEELRSELGLERDE